MEGLNVILGLIFILGFIWYITGGSEEAVVAFGKVFLGVGLMGAIIWIVFNVFELFF